MNLSDFRTRVARVVGMSVNDADDLALIDSWTNEAVVQFLKDTKMYVDGASMTTTAGTGDYTLDSNIITLTDLWYEPSDGSQSRILQPVDSREIIRMRLFTSTSEHPLYYGVQGVHRIMLYPTPTSSTDELHILYVPRPSATIAATGDSPADATRGNIPVEFHPTLEAYVLWKAARAEEHRPSENGQIFAAEYDIGTARARADMNRKSGVFRAPVRFGKRLNIPTTPGTDIRYAYP